MELRLGGLPMYDNRGDKSISQGGTSPSYRSSRMGLPLEVLAKKGTEARRI